jgi:hypothetical protein
MGTKREYENAQAFLWITRESEEMYRMHQLYCAQKKEAGDHLKAQYKQSIGQRGKKSTKIVFNTSISR